MVDMITRLGQDAEAPDLSDRDAVRQWVEALPPSLNSPVGGNTPCVEIRCGDRLFVVDGGTGLATLGVELANTAPLRLAAGVQVGLAAGDGGRVLLQSGNR